MPLYRFDGPRAGEETSQEVILEVASNGNVLRKVGVGQVGEFTDSQYEELRGRLRLISVEDSDKKDLTFGPGHEDPKEEQREDTRSDVKSEPTKSSK